MRRGSRGFTIIEVIVVMTIIIVLAGLVAAVTQKIRERALIVRTRSLIADIETGLEMFRSDLGGYPSSAGWANPNLYSCLTQSSGSYVIGTTTFPITTPPWSGPYVTFNDSDVTVPQFMNPSQIIDAWGTSLTYRNPDNSGHTGTYVDIISSGPDKALSTADDITNWTK